LPDIAAERKALDRMSQVLPELLADRAAIGVQGVVNLIG
jgi:hypothetical protein